MNIIHHILQIPALIPFYGLISTICGYLALYRYWENWFVFASLLILGWIKGIYETSLARDLQEKGYRSDTAPLLGSITCVLQTTIIIIFVRSFY